MKSGKGSVLYLSITNIPQYLVFSGLLRVIKCVKKAYFEPILPPRAKEGFLFGDLLLKRQCKWW